MQDYSTSTNALIVQKLIAFDNIHIQHPRMQQAHGIFDFLRQLGREKSISLCQQDRSNSNTSMPGVRMLGPTASGKSRSVESYIRNLNLGPDTYTVLHVFLQQNATPKRLWVDILSAFGDPYAHDGQEAQLKSRAITYIERGQVELIVFDEIQQLLTKSGTARTWRASEALKRFIDEGHAPVVLMGTFEAEPLFSGNPQLGGRLLAPLDFTPMDALSPEDIAIFKGFFGRLDQQLVERECLSQPIGLMRPELLSKIFAVTTGVLGLGSRLIREAIQIAYRSGRTYVVVGDLSFAVERWAMPIGICDFNPFHDLTLDAETT